MTNEERKTIYNEFKKIDQYKDENNLYYSNSFEHNVFMRYFNTTC